MNPTPPAISVIIPAYNRENYLGEAIRSALDQTLAPDEVIVVDDGSTDHTGNIARSFPDHVRCIHQQNQGISQARNRGIEAATGRFLAFLDSDDLWLPEKLEWQMTYLQSHPSTAMVFGHMENFISPELESTDLPAVDPRPIPGLCASTLLIRREALAAIGAFDPSYTAGEFLEWFSRSQDQGLTYHVLEERVTRRRVHLSNTVLDRQHLRLQYTRVLKTVLGRRRSREPKTG